MADRAKRSRGHREPSIGQRESRRSGIASASPVLGLGLAVTGSLWQPPRPVLLWNASPSTPTGLYLVTPPSVLRRGDTVVAWAPSWARRLAAARAYLPAGIPLVKPVAAVAGDRVCAVDAAIFVNGRLAATRRPRDPLGRPMPGWGGCRILRQGELFLLSAGVPEAFDGRYFGVTRAGELVGKARLLWALWAH